MPKQKNITIRTSSPKALTKSLKDLKLAKEKAKEAQRLLFHRKSEDKTPRSNHRDIILALNRALAGKGMPDFLRVVDASYTRSGAISVLLKQGALGTILVPDYSDLLIMAVCKEDQEMVSVGLLEQ